MICIDLFYILNWVAKIQDLSVVDKSVYSVHNTVVNILTKKKYIYSKLNNNLYGAKVYSLKNYLKKRKRFALIHFIFLIELLKCKIYLQL